MSRFGNRRRSAAVRTGKPPAHAVERAPRKPIRNFRRGSAGFSPAVGPRHRSFAFPPSAGHSFFWTIPTRSGGSVFSPCGS